MCSFEFLTGSQNETIWDSLELYALGVLRQTDPPYEAMKYMRHGYLKHDHWSFFQKVHPYRECLIPWTNNLQFIRYRDELYIHDPL